MRCVKCGSSTKVLDSRKRKEGKQIARRRECLNGHRFTTLEKYITSRDFGLVKRIADLEKRIQLSGTVGKNFFLERSEGGRQAP